MHRSLSPARRAALAAALVLPGLFSARSVAEPAAAAPMTVSVAGVRVSREVQFDGDKPERVGMGMSATGVHLLVESRGGSLVQILTDKSALKSFRDDKGTDLLAAKPKFGGTFNSFPKFAKDRRSCLLEVQSDALPAPGARVLIVEGAVAFTLAEGEEAAKADAVKLAKGVKFAAGGLALTVEASGKPQWGDDPQEVTLQVAAAVDPVSKIRFLDTAGQEIPSHRTGTMAMRGFGAGTLSWTYGLKKAADTATVEVTLWKGLKEVTVPVKLEFGIGL